VAMSVGRCNCVTTGHDPSCVLSPFTVQRIEYLTAKLRSIELESSTLNAAARKAVVDEVTSSVLDHAEVVLTWP
jgi:hypothetical protein